MKKSSQKKSSFAAATKADLAQMESRLVQHVDVKLTSHISGVKKEFASDIADAKSELKSDIADAKSELIRYIDLKHEQLVYDFRGIFGDRTTQQDEKNC